MLNVNVSGDRGRGVVVVVASAAVVVVVIVVEHLATGQAGHHTRFGPLVDGVCSQE